MAIMDQLLKPSDNPGCRELECSDQVFMHSHTDSNFNISDKTRTEDPNVDFGYRNDIKTGLSPKHTLSVPLWGSGEWIFNHAIPTPNNVCTQGNELNHIPPIHAFNVNVVNETDAKDDCVTFYTGSDPPDDDTTQTDHVDHSEIISYEPQPDTGELVESLTVPELPPLKLTRSTPNSPRPKLAFLKSFSDLFSSTRDSSSSKDSILATPTRGKLARTRSYYSSKEDMQKDSIPNSPVPQRGKFDRSRSCCSSREDIALPNGSLGRRDDFRRNRSYSEGTFTKDNGECLESRSSSKTLLTVPSYSELDLQTIRKQVRRGSVTPSVTKSEDGSISLNKPRRRLSNKFESLNYNTMETQEFIDKSEKVSAASVKRTALTRWFVNFMVGVYVAIIAVLVALAITYLSKVKFMGIYALIEYCDSGVCLLLPTIVWMLINMVLIFIGAYVVTFHAPHAAGSGIPQIKCYLNGIKLPGLLSIKTLVAKAGGVVLSVGGGLACGKEGPMIHSGAICASGMASAEFKCGRKTIRPSCCDELRSDEERRDFVAAGAASGVSAAFASPIGGVLFSMEEGASYINQMLTWRMLFSSMTASLLLNIMMSAIKGHPADMSNPGLVSFGYIGDVKFKTWELPIFMFMAIIGGLSGALFVQLNYHITIMRRKYIKSKWAKVIEAVTVAACSAIVLMLLMFLVPDCAPIPGYHPPANTTGLNDTLAAELHDAHDIHKRGAPAAPAEDTTLVSDDAGHHEEHSLYGLHGAHGYVFQGFCPYGEHNRMADILFKTPEGGLHAMLHGDKDAWSVPALLVLFVVYHLLATWTYGLSVSSGVFIPSLLIGAIYGRITGVAVLHFIPEAGPHITKYVLVGAACQLGGTVRMTISLTVIVIECTGDITFGIPVILSLILAKWMGDYFNPGIYDLHIEIMGIPLLPWEPPAMCFNIRAYEMMSAPVVTMRTQEKVGRIDEILNSESFSHNGFPVVEDYEPEDIGSSVNGTFGRLKGFILKSKLQELISGEEVSDEEKEQTIDLRPHMDPTPYSVVEDTSLPKIFKLFRGVGLRHLMVINERNRVVGIITRINLARYRGEIMKGKYHLEELEIMDS